MVISVATAKAQAQLVIEGGGESVVESQAQTLGVAVPVLEAAAGGLEPGGRVGLNW
jgi:hypothetical protein